MHKHICILDTFAFQMCDSTLQRFMESMYCVQDCGPENPNPKEFTVYRDEKMSACPDTVRHGSTSSRRNGASEKITAADLLSTS